ncbi:hypothetical protein Q3G72_021831 [Acer saccharum]|nr:hypothetical protein Q3G72_006638 [Acer saccharum]KAK1583207.1 hypothetical protein Q3G72_021831 [Acer saccharum]
MSFQSILLSSFLVLLFVAHVKSSTFNVEDNGARGDSKSNDIEAFYKTWNQACQSTEPSTVIIPAGKFLVGPAMAFSGPCKGPINFNLQGDLVAPTDEASLLTENWVSFQNLNQLTINGGGSIDGQGASAWPHKNCKNQPTCKPLPIGSSGVKISDVHFSNIQGTTMTQIAVTLNCSESNPCQKIEMRDINIAYNGVGGPAKMRDINIAYNGGGGPEKSACANAHGAAYGQENPPSCLIASRK